tara:strand:- start:2322 stop:3026 length:705 start_codon:yes stop_codon:yes gene_type:complete
MTNFAEHYNVFSGADIRAFAIFQALNRSSSTGDSVLYGTVDPNKDLKHSFRPLHGLQTISYSVFREKSPVRALGSPNERGKARGTRTIGGSMVFTNFDRNPFFDNMIISENDQGGAGNMPSYTYSHRMPDQLAPFDILIHFANEYGHSAELVLYGINIMSEGAVMSSENMITETTYQFTAGDMSILRPGGYKDQNPRVESDSEDVAGAKTGRNILANFLLRREEIARRNASGAD